MQESAELREELEEKLERDYEAARDLTGVKRLKAYKALDRAEERLAWQGANPKEIPFDDLKEHITYPVGEDAIEDKYRSKIKNRATAIRAYCVSCMGGSVSDVKDCVSLICPLHPFRMGKDPIRGYELPKVENIIIEDDEEESQFEDDEEEDDDATE